MENQISGITESVVCDLKRRYKQTRKLASVFGNPSVKTELEYLHEYFVICLVDEASKNVAIICKYYLETILNECRLTQYRIIIFLI